MSNHLERQQYEKQTVQVYLLKAGGEQTWSI